MTLQHGAIAQLGERYAGSVEVRVRAPWLHTFKPLFYKVFLFVRNRAIAQKAIGDNLGTKNLF